MAASGDVPVTEATSSKSIWDKLLCTDIFGADSIRTEIGEGMQSVSKIREAIDVLTFKLGLLTSKLNSISILTDDHRLEQEYEIIKGNRFIVNGNKRRFIAENGREPTDEELKTLLKEYLRQRSSRTLKDFELEDLRKTKDSIEIEKIKILSDLRDTENLLEIQKQFRDSEPSLTESNYRVAQSRILLFLYGFRKELSEVLETKADLTENEVIVKEILEESTHESIKKIFIERIDLRAIKLFTYDLCGLLKRISLSDFEVNSRYALIEESLRSKGSLLMGGHRSIFDTYYNKKY